MFTRTPIPQSAARKIQAMILSGELKAGERIPGQRHFSQHLGVSRASLREALLTLETLGLVRTQPGSGTVVTGTDSASDSHMSRWRYSDRYSVAEVFQTRIMLEGQIASLAARVLSDGDILKLEKATDDMERFWSTHDLLANVEADLEFHATIARACGNTMLIALYETVRDQLIETQRQPIPITAPSRMRESIAEHRRIIEALRSGHGAGAKREMKNHILKTAQCAGLELDIGR